MKSANIDYSYNNISIITSIDSTEYYWLYDFLRPLFLPTPTYTWMYLDVRLHVFMLLDFNRWILSLCCRMACPFCYSSHGACNINQKESWSPLIQIVPPPEFSKCLVSCYWSRVSFMPLQLTNVTFKLIFLPFSFNSSTYYASIATNLMNGSSLMKIMIHV